MHQNHKSFFIFAVNRTLSCRTENSSSCRNFPTIFSY